jgi:hypothetical protein
MTKSEMVSKIIILQNEIAVLEGQIEAFDSAIENNQYADHADAESRITDRYSDIAHEQCEGAGNCGEPQFKQKYQIAGNPNLFEATVDFEYNRHDKTYYYIDGTDYSYVELEPISA